MRAWPQEETLREIRAQAREASVHFRLPLGRRAWSGRAGAWAGVGRGVSLEFQDHRPYVPGDDPRHINWPAYARSGVYSMKLYREEVSPAVDVILDASASMFLDQPKRDRALQVFLFALESAAAAGASTRAFAVTGHGWVGLPALGQGLGALPADGPARVPRIAYLPRRPGALRIVVSDCLFPDPPPALLRPLAAARERGLLLVPFANAEALPGWTGQIEMIDCESEKRRTQRVDDGVRASYREAYARHFDLWRDACARWGVAFCRLAPEGSLAEVLRRDALARGAVEAAR